MLKNMDPPLGFGNKCPNRLAYKKLIRMNMPVDDDGKVNFTTTFFALVRENLSIKMRTGKLTFLTLQKLLLDLSKYIVSNCDGKCAGCEATNLMFSNSLVSWRVIGSKATMCLIR